MDDRSSRHDARMPTVPNVLLIVSSATLMAAVSLAGLGPDRTCIRILADPTVNRNRHTVTAEGGFGRLRIELENVPSENPRTGKLSYLSTIAYLRDLAAPLRVGT